MGSTVSNNNDNRQTEKGDAIKHDNTNNDKIEKRESEEAQFLRVCALNRDDMIRLKDSEEERRKSTVPVSSIEKGECLSIHPMTFWEEAACILFLSVGVPNGIFVIPALTYGIGYFVLGNTALAFKTLGLLLLPLTILPQPFVPATLQSWLSIQILKYFSFRFIFEERSPVRSTPSDAINASDKTSKTNASGNDSNSNNKNPRPQILVAPPHGVFPYGNILSELMWPSMAGYHFHGLAANSALRVPVFKQVLRSIGVIDASRTSARRALERYPYTIGISTGGVAEVFETNADHECILLKERTGLVKLAIRTGADLVPCYLFGNTKLLHCWAGEGVPGARRVLEYISRKYVGFAMILFFGRWGLPIPKRVPVLGVMGKPIPTSHIQCEEPTNKQVESIQKLLIDEMQEIFERYKGLYGWEDIDLIIK